MISISFILAYECAAEGLFALTLLVMLLCADLILFTATANTSIVTLNLSLMLNKVGFYQVHSPPVFPTFL